MKKICFLLLAVCMVSPLYSQNVHAIKADSVKLTNDSLSTDLIIESNTRNVRGFLFNKGSGRTGFKPGLIPVTGSTSKYVIGCDTLDLGTVFAVHSVFGRTGSVTAQASDYSAYYPQLSSTYPDPSWITALAQSKVTYTGTSGQYINGTGVYTTLPVIPNDAGLLHTTGNESKSGVLSLASNPIHSSMTSGSVPYYGTGGQLREANTRLFWDSSSNRLKVNGLPTILGTSLDGIKWVYNSTSHQLSNLPLAWGGSGPNQFWNVQTVTAANQSRTNLRSYFSMQRGFMMGTIENRNVNVMLDFSRSRPTVSTFDLGDVVINAGNVLWFDAKPEVLVWKKIGTSGTTAYQWAEVTGESEYQYQTTNATVTSLFSDVGGTGMYKYRMRISATNTSTGDVWMSERIYVFGKTAGVLAFKNLTTVSNYSEGTMSGCAVSYAIGGGPPSNQLTWRIAGLASTTIEWRVSVTRTIF